MTPEALDGVLGEVVTVLQQNQAFMTTDMLLRVEQMYAQVKGAKDIIAVGLQLTLDQMDRLFAMGDKIIAFEQTMVSTPMTANFIEAINGVRARPLIMRLLAALLN